MHSDEAYKAFLLHQAGFGIEPFRGQPIVFPTYQSGSGFGSFATSFFKKHFIPLLGPLFRNLSTTTANIATDLIDRPEGEDVKTIFKRRGLEGAKDMAKDVIGHVKTQVGQGRRRKRKLGLKKTRTATSKKRRTSKRVYF